MRRPGAGGGEGSTMISKRDPISVLRVSLSQWGADRNLISTLVERGLPRWLRW